MQGRMMLSSQLDPEVSALLSQDTMRCSTCKQDKPILECYTYTGRCKECHAMHMAKWYQRNKNTISLAKRHENAVRCAQKWVEKLVLEGECLVCKGQHFHVDGCEANGLLVRLREIR